MNSGSEGFGHELARLGVVLEAEEVAQLVSQWKKRDLTPFSFPLRAINSLADFVIEDCNDKLPPECLEHLQTIKLRIFRMQRLLEDLLEYSQVGHGQSLRQTARSRAVIDRTIELCSIPSTISVEVIDEDVEVETWITPLETCLRNLVGNSVKHRDSATGRIQVRCRQIDDFILFSVSDDGRGIPAEHFERVFRMFETLRRRDEVEGSGMGLALVKKTVETYGGSISVESLNEWSGTTFHLRWPNAMSKSSKSIGTS